MYLLQIIHYKKSTYTGSDQNTVSGFRNEIIVTEPVNRAGIRRAAANLTATACVTAGK